MFFGAKASCREKVRKRMALVDNSLSLGCKWANWWMKYWARLITEEKHKLNYGACKRCWTIGLMCSQNTETLFAQIFFANYFDVMKLLAKST